SSFVTRARGPARSSIASRAERADAGESTRPASSPPRSEGRTLGILPRPGFGLALASARNPGSAVRRAMRDPVGFEAKGLLLVRGGEGRLTVPRELGREEQRQDGQAHSGRLPLAHAVSRD